MTEPTRWLTRTMVEAFQRESIKRFGGEDGLRDPALLESALARPWNRDAYSSTATIFELAAAYCHGIIRNHPFVDGNKRTGLLATAVFLSMNGFEMTPDEAEIVTMIEGLAAGEVTETELAMWLADSSNRKG